MRQGLIGAVLTRSVGPGQIAGMSGAPWCADNECFTRGDEFDLDRYLEWLDRQDRSTCLFATAPDVLCDAAATLARSAPVLPVIRAMGFPAALVAQNGLEHLDVPWDTFDALFIGGDTAWKLGAAAHGLILEAKSRGKWVHMGRVNGESRFRRADVMGCDSVDGTFLAFGPDKNLPRLLSWDAAPALMEAQR
jgi:hypothetical protein